MSVCAQWKTPDLLQVQVFNNSSNATSSSTANPGNIVNNQDSLTIKILEKEYRVACPTEEKESLQASASMLNAKLDEIKSKGAVIGTERIAVMAALNMSHEVLSGKSLADDHIQLNERIDNLSERIDKSMRQIKLI